MPFANSKDQGLSADGVVGPGTASKLDEVLMQVQGSTDTSVDSQQNLLDAIDDSYDELPLRYE